jgi:glycosyltransferase involved in cell wall biosynthesis
MRIAMLVNNLDVSGGYQKLVLRLAEELEKRGHSVTTYTPSADRLSCYPELIRRVKVVTPESHPRRAPSRLAARLMGPCLTALKFYGLARIVDPDWDALIIHDEQMLYTLSGINTGGKPVAWMLNNELPDGLETRASRFSLQLERGNFILRVLKGVLRYPARQVEWLLFWRGVSKVTAAATYDEFNRVQVEKRLSIASFNVQAGADVESFRALASRRNPGRGAGVHVLSVGVMFPHRRYEDLIRAIASVRAGGIEVRLTIVGRRDLCPEYSGTVSRLPIELGCESWISFQDALSEEELQALYCEADVFAFVNDGKTWGISVFEAVAAQVPVIITSNVGAADLMGRDALCWVVPPRDPEAIANAIREIAADPADVKEKALRASERVLPTVAWQAYAERMLSILEEPVHARI